MDATHACDTWIIFFFSSRRRHTRFDCDWSSDVCSSDLEATQNINPTKTLEYMAAGKPVISTAVPDVVRNFVPIVEIAHSHDEFVALARREIGRASCRERG